MKKNSYYKLPGIGFRCLSIFLGIIFIIAVILVPTIFLIEGPDFSKERAFCSSTINMIGAASMGLDLLMWCLIYWLIGSFCFLPTQQDRKYILTTSASFLKKIRNLLICSFCLELIYVIISGVKHETWYSTEDVTSLDVFLEDLVLFLIPNISGITTLVLAFIIGLIGKLLLKQIEVEDELDMVV